MLLLRLNVPLAHCTATGPAYIPLTLYKPSSPRFSLKHYIQLKTLHRTTDFLSPRPPYKHVSFVQSLVIHTTDVHPVTDLVCRVINLCVQPTTQERPSVSPWTAPAAGGNTTANQVGHCTCGAGRCVSYSRDFIHNGDPFYYCGPCGKFITLSLSLCVHVLYVQLGLTWRDETRVMVSHHVGTSGSSPLNTTSLAERLPRLLFFRLGAMTWSFNLLSVFSLQVWFCNECCIDELLYNTVFLCPDDKLDTT